ncbi:FAST kinase domain-containing protein 1, mitochondrial [Halichoeres trimaculatus]|uniref:FAST kinase domain-containing protein 1, mitochondrial n=1 Tax=Halichoeres trimaculatus TaxID=147232 RepID=UPI003D9EB073
MFRLRCVNSSLRRLFHIGTVNRDQVLEQLQVCSAEDQVFDVVGKNKAKLTVDHVSQAVGMLWEIQREKPELLRTVSLIKNNPQFLTLRVLAENKIALMEDSKLVDMLYRFMRLGVDPHDSLIQQIISEAWLRIDRLELSSLSKFAVCLNDLQLYHSPLMGHIVHIVDQRLSSIDDARVLTTLMVSLSYLVSPRLHNAFITRIDRLLDDADPSNYNNPRRVVQYLRNTRHPNRPLLEKCNKIFMQNIQNLDIESVNVILGLYQSIHFNNCDLRLALKQRLIDVMDSCPDPYTFSRVFASLAPMANQEIRERLENSALLLADEFTPLQAVAIAETLEEVNSRNLSLFSKIASIIQKNLHVYKPVELSRITQSLLILQYQNPELFTKLRTNLINFLQSSVYPCEVTMLIRVLSLMPTPRLDAGVISRMEGMLPQCSLSDLNAIAVAVAKWVRFDPSHHHNTPSNFVRLLQALNRCGTERLQTANRLDLLLEELKYLSGEWFEEILLEETIIVLQRMMDQINWKNVPELATFVVKLNHLIPPLMDQIASVALQDIEKIHPSFMYPTLLPFGVLNYDSVKADELYDACIQHVTPRIGCLDPHMLVFLTYLFALADIFPEEFIQRIFNVDFLGKLDAQLETVPDSLNMRTRLRLMELNRAACLECPEFQVPWFHERYCQQLQRKGHTNLSPAQQQIHKMLSEVLGGINFVRGAVVTPYYYTIDFECILDKNLHPLPYSEPRTLQIPDRGKGHWESNSLESSMAGLPSGAQRVAVEFLDSKSFCKNLHHMKGEALMKKRHLEILGYRVVQIPHFEWNSMELSTQDAWKKYLKKKIFGKLPP